MLGDLCPKKKEYLVHQCLKARREDMMCSLSLASQNTKKKKQKKRKKGFLLDQVKNILVLERTLIFLPN
jgi:hypothetical protein